MARGEAQVGTPLHICRCCRGSASLPSALRRLRSHDLPLQELPDNAEHGKEEESDGAARGDGSCSGYGTVWVSVRGFFVVIFSYFIADVLSFFFFFSSAQANER